jgi:hypothetical protein
MKTEEADKSRIEMACEKTPMTKNGGWGKNSHQLRLNNTSTKKTWADVVKSGGINVQIVLGNGNLGLTIPTKMRGERCGGVAQRLAKRREDRERGTKGRGNESPEVISSGGNKGGQMGKNGSGREEERGEPGVVALVQAGHLDQTMHG